MNNPNKPLSPLVRRRRQALALGIGTVLAGGAMFLEAHHSSSELHKPTSDEISATATNIRQAATIEHSTVYLGPDVAFRSSMKIIDPVQGEHRTNAVKRVKHGHVDVLTDPVLEKDKQGNEWYMTQLPGEAFGNTEDKAKITVYVAKTALLANHKNDPASITIQPNKDGSPISEVPVQYKEDAGVGHFESLDGAQLPYVMTATD
jgi:hypothetical protein